MPSDGIKKANYTHAFTFMYIHTIYIHYNSIFKDEGAKESY